MSISKESTIERFEFNTSNGIALLKLATDLESEYSVSGDVSVLDSAIRHSANSIQSIPQDHPDHFLSWHRLASCLWSRSKISSSKDDLDLAIHFGTESLIRCSFHHPKRIYAFNILGRALLTKFEHRGDRRDLELSVMYFKDALSLHAADHPGMDMVFVGFANAMLNRYYQYGDLQDVAHCINYYRQALSFRPAGHPELPSNLHNLSLALRMRFRHDLTPADLEASFACAKEALSLCSPGHIVIPHIFVNLSECLLWRFQYYGDLADLDSSLVYSSNALSLRPVGHPERGTTLARMASNYETRYLLHGTLSDIDTSIKYLQEVLLIDSPGGFRRHFAFHAIGIAFRNRFTEDGDAEDLRTSIQCHEEALVLCPVNHFHRASLLISLASSLTLRFENFGDIHDLQLAIAHLDAALKVAVPFTFQVVGELALALLHRYQVFCDVADLNMAFDYLHTAKTRTPSGHSYLRVVYKGFATCYISKFLLDQNPLNQETAFDYYEKATSHAVAGLHSRLRISLEWISESHHLQHPSELSAYKMTLRLLDRYFMVTPHVSVRHGIRRKKTPPTLVADAVSCAIAAGQLEVAVELLEYGKALLWSQLTRIRTPLDALRDRDENGKRLAEEFGSIGRQLEVNNISPMMQQDSSRSDSPARYAALARQWDAVIEEIRKIEGFSNFLSSAPFAELQLAAAEGPIIILNVGLFRSDSLIVLKDQPPRVVPLQLTIHDVHEMLTKFNSIFRMYIGRGEDKRRGSHFVPILRKLWHSAVRSVVNELERLIPRGSRIWWCPTSNLACLPIHAAGPYRKGEPNLPDIYVSSYTPTLSALIRARHKKTTGRSLLGIGQPSPYGGFGQGELQTVEEELGIVEGLCPPLMSFSRLYGPEATADAAMDGLQKHNWIHLACHGKQDAEEPYESCFAMGDKPLRLLDLMQARLDDSQFAFLSACHTAVGDVHTPDEVIHLAAGLQFSGFKSVVGTIGAVDDNTVVQVVEGFYKNIFAEGCDCTDAARALNKTMANLKRKMPLDQRVIFVHIGA